MLANDVNFIVYLFISFNVPDVNKGLQDGYLLAGSFLFSVKLLEKSKLCFLVFEVRRAVLFIKLKQEFQNFEGLRQFLVLINEIVEGLNSAFCHVLLVRYHHFDQLLHFLGLNLEEPLKAQQLFNALQCFVFLQNLTEQIQTLLKEHLFLKLDNSGLQHFPNRSYGLQGNELLEFNLDNVDKCFDVCAYCHRLPVRFIFGSSLMQL